jgi:hypothetical protein
MKILKLVMLGCFLSSGSAFAVDAWSRKISCMAPGKTGVVLNGTFTVFSEVSETGAIGVSYTELFVPVLHFMIDGEIVFEVKNISAITTQNGDNDRWVSQYSSTNSKRIRKIHLVLSNANDAQSDSYVITSKGNQYFMDCSFDSTEASE